MAQGAATRAAPPRPAGARPAVRGAHPLVSQLVPAADDRDARVSPCAPHTGPWTRRATPQRLPQVRAGTFEARGASLSRRFARSSGMTPALGRGRRLAIANASLKPADPGARGVACPRTACAWRSAGRPRLTRVPRAIYTGGLSRALWTADGTVAGPAGADSYDGGRTQECRPTYDDTPVGCGHGVCMTGVTGTEPALARPMTTAIKANALAVVTAIGRSPGGSPLAWTVIPMHEEEEAGGRP